jgi:hypothetical protein
LAATIYKAMGIDLNARLPELEKRSIPIGDADSIGEVLRR